MGEIQSTSPHVTCASCRRQYKILYGKLSRRVSMHEAVLYFNARLPHLYKRHYAFEITTPDRELKRLQFSTAGKEDQVPVRQGDRVSVLYTVRKLIAVVNHTTGRSHVLSNPVPSATYQVALLGTAAIALLLGAFSLGINPFLTAVVSALSFVVYLKLTPAASLTSSFSQSLDIGSQVMADQRLLRYQQQLEQRIEDLAQERQAHQNLIDQIEALKRKMTRVDPHLYRARIYRINSAIGILQRQIDNNQQLTQEYGRTLRMIEIEVETSWIADQLPDPDDFTRTILHRLQELKAIEQQNQALKLQMTDLTGELGLMS